MELITAPNEWLEKAVKPFDFDALDAKEIAGQMAKIMMENNGIGLSANQVGLDAQIFVMRPLQHKEITKPFAVINPQILSLEGDMKMAPEGCLSYPGLVLQVKRVPKLVASFLDIDSNECIIEFEGIDSRCFLHEFDHLQGIDFTQRVSKLRLDRAYKKLEKVRKKYG